MSATKKTTWVNEEWATVELLDGPAKGEYQVSIWGDEDGLVKLGIVTVDGTERTLKTRVEDIEGYAEHKSAAEAKLAAEIVAARKCNRCGKHVEVTAYSQDEPVSFGGSRVMVATYYCDDCRRLLQTVGAGEYTAMDERRG